MKWSTLPLSALGTVQTGSTPSTSEARFWGGDVPFVTPAELEQRTPVTNTPRTLTDEGSHEGRLLREGAVMVCCIGSLGKIGIAGRPLVTNQQINSVEFDPRLVFPKYGYYACHRLKSKLITMAPATTVPIVNKSKFEQLEIPVPPLPEQIRIAAILDQADLLRVKRREALAQLDSLAQSIFIEMFGDPVTNPKKWVTKKLHEVTTFENGDRSGNYPSGDDIKSEGVLFLSTKNIIDGQLDLSHPSYISTEKFASLSRGKARRYDLIITLRGTLGSCCIFDCAHETAFINAQMMIIRPSAECHHTYLQALITSRHTQERLASLSRGAAVPQLTATQLAEFLIPVPPMSDQIAFVKCKDALDKLKGVQESASMELDTLFASLQHRAFSGEL